MANLTKALAVLTLVAMSFGAIAIVATWISPNPIFLKTPSEQLVIQTPSLDLIFKFAQEKQPSQRIIVSMLGALLVAACNFTILSQLHKILLTVPSSPFVPENAHRLRIIALALFASSFLNSVANALSGRWIHEMIQLPNVEAVARFRFDFGLIGAGVLVLVLAEVFRLGVAMKEEQDLTI